MLRTLPKYIRSHAAVIVRDNISHSDNRPEIKAVKLLSGYFINVSCRFSENLKFPLNRTNAQSVRGEAFLGLTTGKILNMRAASSMSSKYPSDLDGIDGLCTTKDRFPLDPVFHRCNTLALE